MILYLHGFDATSPGNHEKMRQLQFLDSDVRLVSYSTQYPRHDMQQLLNDVARELRHSDDPSPLLIGVGLGGYWAERIGFLHRQKTVMINPNLHPEISMLGRIDRPEEYADIASKCVSEFRNKNRNNALCILSVQDEVQDSRATASLLSAFYPIIWDEHQSHKFPLLGPHLPAIKAFWRG